MDVLLRDVLKQIMREQKITQLELVSRMQGKIQQGNLSAALNGKRQFTLAMLDAITEALQLEKGSLYLYYGQECFDRRGNLRPRKSKEFIIRCYEMGLGRVTERLVNRLIEYGSENGPVLFSIAERLFEMGKFSEALPFYSTVIDMEAGTQNESDRLPISCYRRFAILNRLQSEFTYDAFVTLAGHLKNMPKQSEHRLPGDSANLKFDAYGKAIMYCMERDIWHRVTALSEQLGSLAIAEKNMPMYGQSLLYLGEAAFYLKNYTLVSQLLDQCESIQSPSLQREIEVFRLRLAMETGDASRFDDCLRWLFANPDHLGKLLPALLKLCLDKDRLQDAARLLAEFGEALSRLQKKRDRFVQKKWNVKMNRLLAEYFLRAGLPDQAWEKLLSALQSAASLALTADVMDCLLLYEEYRDLAEEPVRDRFLRILRNGRMKG